MVNLNQFFKVGPQSIYICSFSVSDGGSDEGIGMTGECRLLKY